MRKIVFGAALALAAALTGAQAADHPLDAAKLVLRQQASGAARMIFIARSSLVEIPSPGGLSDPRSVGATVELFARDGERATFLVPAGEGRPGWRLRGEGSGFVYTRPGQSAAGSAVRAVALRQHRALRIAAGDAGLTLDATLDSVGVRLTIGTLRLCALFAPATVVRDEAGIFVARRAVAAALADCGDSALAGAICGNGVREPVEDCDGGDDAACPGDCLPTCVCQGFCGDGIVNQTSEVCDAGAGTCGVGLECASPGHPNECLCCAPSFGCAFASCCDPLATCVYNPLNPLTYNRCVRILCTETDDCTQPSVCGDDGECCIPAGEHTGPVPFYLDRPCCEGLSTVEVNPLTFLCCGGAGVSCGDAGECCSGHCTASTCE